MNNDSCINTDHIDTGIASGDWLDVRACGVSGSEAEIRVSTQAGSNIVTADAIGDFKPGHGVLISGNPSCTEGLIWRAGIQAEWQTDMPVRPLESLYHAVPDPACYKQIDQHYRKSEKKTEPLDGAVEVRGYDGGSEPVTVYYLEIDGEDPLTFRWSDDVARTWKGQRVPVSETWQPLSAGVEIRFLKSSWSFGDAILFDMRDWFPSRIKEISGNSIILEQPVPATVDGALMRHEDSAALQEAVNTAICTNRNIALPAGRYRLLKGIAVINPGQLRIEGVNAGATLLDMTEGVGAGFWIFRGDDVIIRNLGMVGHTGMQEGLPYRWRTISGRDIWRTHCLRPARAVEIRGTRRVLVENVTVRRIACECFYSQAPSSSDADPEKPSVLTEALTFLRCEVTDVGFNAFNNNDIQEGTSVLYCRMVDVGNCAWEGPARFIKFIGNHVRNCGSCSIGNTSRRTDELCKRGCGQSVFADNVFEGTSPGRIAISVTVSATQVVIRNNLFVNMNASAICVGSHRQSGQAFPVRNVIVADNIINLTCRDSNPIQRSGIEIGGSDTIVCNNQIYVNGTCDLRVSGILVLEPATNIVIHNNVVRNCREGIISVAQTGRVGLVVDSRTFEAEGAEIPQEWPHEHGYRSWRLIWTGNDLNPEKRESVIDHYDAKSCRFVLRDPWPMFAGDSFEVVAPSFNWNIHDNIIENCMRPATLAGHGGVTSLFRNNIIQQGNGLTEYPAISAPGAYIVENNRIAEHQPPVSDTDGVKTHPAFAPEPPTAWHIPKTDTMIELDGNAEKWDWNDSVSAIALAQCPSGIIPQGWRARACAVWNESGLMIALRLESDKPVSLRTDSHRGDWCKGDGVGLVFRSDTPDKRGPIFNFWGRYDGLFRFMPLPGPVADRVKYVARETADGWMAEILLPLPLLGMNTTTPVRLRMNLGFRNSQLDDWLLWMPAGIRIQYGFMPKNPDRAGFVLLTQKAED